MPIPSGVTTVNKRFLNKAMVHLAGIGPFVEIEHLGRRSRTVYRTPIMAFREGNVVTIALTYGRDVDWLKNVAAAGGCRMHHRRSLLSLGAPRDVPASEGSRRMPVGPRQILPLIRCEDFVELEVESEAPFTTW